MSKIKNVSYILIVVILIFMAIGIILSYSLGGKESTTISQEKDIKKETQKEEESAPVIPTPPEEKWITYTSSELGFSIKYPEIVYGNSYKCGSEKPFYVPLKVFEDDKNGIVYIVKEYFYKGKYDEKLGKYIGPCEKITRSLKSLQEGGRSGGWAISTRNIKNENELNKFIKDSYSPGCFMESKNFWQQQTGVYEIGFGGFKDAKGNPTGLDNAVCPVNYTYKILYIPEKNKAMSVKLGQECSFETDHNSKDYKCYDWEMINSFRFE